MRANTNSLHAKLYKFIWSGDLPENLCPYFWKLVLSIIFLIPVLIVRIPIYFFSLVIMLYHKIVGIKGEDGMPEERVIQNMIGFLIGSFIYAILTVIWSEIMWFKWLFNAYSYDFGGPIVGGAVNGGLLFFLTYYLFSKIKSRKVINDYPNIISEFISAKYYEYCPKIEWETPNKK